MSLLAQASLLDRLPEPLRGTTGLAIVAGVGGLLLLVLLRRLFRRKPEPSPDTKLQENLKEYPPPPLAGARQLQIQGTPARIRLIVLAPVGRNPLGQEEVEAILNEVLRGLGDVAKQDKPRVRVWPSQLSSQGFAPTFHRVTLKPEKEGTPSRWILLAGPASAGRRPVLLGMAVLTDQPTTRGRVTVEANSWAEMLRIVNS